MGNDVIFREAREDDLEAIVALLADDVLGKTREYTAALGKYALAFRAIADQPNNVVYVGDRDGLVVATAQMTLIANISLNAALRAQIEGVRVADEMRGKGCGRDLINWLIEIARRQGAELVQLTTNKKRADAIRFYKDLGFEASHEGMKLYLRDER